MNPEEYPQAAADLFRTFVTDARRLRCGAKEKIMPRETVAEVDFDFELPENRERAILHTWDLSAPQWAGIESVPTYTLTMATIINRLMRITPPTNRKFRILSLGAGPGLYEIFLAIMYKVGKQPAVVYSLDYSEKMIEFQRAALHDKRLTINGNRLGSLEPDFFRPVHGDMTDLSQFEGKIDLLICNNSLQWAADWKKAVAEMGKAMNPEGTNAAFLVIHPHPMCMKMGDIKVSRDHVTLEGVRDEMQKAKFEQCWQRLMLGAPGSGQSTARMERMFMDFRFRPEGAPDWRTLKTSIAGVQHLKVTD